MGHPGGTAPGGGRQPDHPARPVLSGAVRRGWMQVGMSVCLILAVAVLVGGTLLHVGTTSGFGYVWTAGPAPSGVPAPLLDQSDPTSGPSATSTAGPTVSRTQQPTPKQTLQPTTQPDPTPPGGGGDGPPPDPTSTPDPPETTDPPAPTQPPQSHAATRCSLSEKPHVVYGDWVVLCPPLPAVQCNRIFLKVVSADSWDRLCVVRKAGDDEEGDS